MKISIWDMDYYYAKDKTNLFNPDLMKISSYHKQMGDQVNFVEKEDDINRPYDKYYIFKNNEKLPNPPLKFYLDSTVIWGGYANRFRSHWQMSDAMLICRPDYLLYPEKSTPLERAEHIRLLDSQGQLFVKRQDWTNTFKNKIVLVTDDKLWSSDQSTILSALQLLKDSQKVSFLEPIWTEKLLSDKIVRDAFFQLKIARGNTITWTPVFLERADNLLELARLLSQNFHNIDMGQLRLKVRYDAHWEERGNQQAYQDWTVLRRTITTAKHEKLKVGLASLQHRLDTPFFELFENMSDWTQHYLQMSWLEYITAFYGSGDKYTYWTHPNRWSVVFRNILRQTYFDASFLLTQWGDKSISENDIPWSLWQEEFKWGI